jgi:hypothetical protein
VRARGASRTALHLRRGGRRLTTNQKARRIAKTAPTHFRFALQHSLHKFWLYVAHDGEAHKVDSVSHERAQRWTANTPSAPNPGIAGTFYCPICDKQREAAAARSRQIASKALMFQPDQFIVNEESQ